MKTPFISLILLSAAMVVGGLSACNTTQQRTAFKTLASVEMTTTAAVDGYFSATIKGIAPTNGIPKVSAAYNDFQKAFIVAVDLAQNNTNALSPDSLVQEGADIVSLVGQFYHPSTPKLNPTP